MQAERQTNHQVRVEVKNQNGTLMISFPDGQQITWPIVDLQVANGVKYLTLSATPMLPSKSELAKTVLQEILKIDQ